MKRLWLRSTVFNILFYILTGLACVVFLPALALPRPAFMAVVHGFVRGVYFLERCILGLDFEIRGREHVPQAGAFIVAAKHQSTYETFKLHLLFKDPAIILKKELLSIPLWGLYLKKSDVIAIDRSTPEKALRSMQEGAQRMVLQGRPIVIFPQGTRVRVEDTVETRPYKPGIKRIAEATQLSIIPMALNSGLYWPRSSWLKSSGTVIFKFLGPIQPGMERAHLMNALEETLESESRSLANEGREKSASKGYGLMAFFMSIAVILLVLFGVYSYTWTKVADHIRAEYPKVMQDMVGSAETIATPEITGYPGKIKFYVAQETLSNSQGSVTFKEVRAESWPMPYQPIDIITGPIEIENFRWPEKLNFDLLKLTLDMENEKFVTLTDSLLQRGTFKANVTGTINLYQEPFPLLNLLIKLDDHQSLLQDMGLKGMIEARTALFMNAGLTALANEQGIVEVQVAQKGNMLYAGPLPIMALPPTRMSGDAPIETVGRTPISVGETPETPAPPAPSP